MSIMYDWGAQAGIRVPYEEVQNQFAWGRRELSVLFGANISGATRDAGSTPTSVCRAGLLLGYISSSKMWVNYNPLAADGSQTAVGILAGPSLRMTDINGSNQNKAGVVIVSGPVLASKLFGLDYTARAQMANRFIFDDDITGAKLPWRAEMAKTADYTIVAADNNMCFTNAGAVGAVAFTLPALLAGLSFDFFVVADQTLSVTSPEGNNIVVANDAAASSVGFATGGDKIGGRLRLTCNQAGTLWFAEKACSNALTIT